MYLQYYGLTEPPFTLNPDPDFLYLGEKHQAAYSRMEYGLLHQAPFCVLTGDVGMGKTVIIQSLIKQIKTDKRFTVGLLTNTQSDIRDLLRWILLTFNLDFPEDDKAKAHQIFYGFLINEYANNRQVVLIVDEAQNLDVETLERLRLLSNINADKHQVLQTILVGQDGLQETLKRPELRQFAQRITYSYHLEPFGKLDTRDYILHRLAVAGQGERKIFTSAAFDRIFHYSQGIPRLINILCDAALVYGFSDEREKIDYDIIEEIVKEKRKGRILPLRDQVFVSEEMIADQIDALTAKMDTISIESTTEALEQKERDKEEFSGEGVLSLKERRKHKQQQQQVKHKAPVVEVILPEEKTVNYSVRETEVLAVKELKGKGLNRSVIIGIAVLFLIMVSSVFLKDFDKQGENKNLVLSVEKDQKDLDVAAKINNDSINPSGDIETADDSDHSSQTLVKIEIPEQALAKKEEPKLIDDSEGLVKDRGGNFTDHKGAVNMHDSMVASAADEMKDIPVKEENIEAVQKKALLSQQKINTEQVKDHSETESLITTQESAIDRSIEHVKNFFQFLNPGSEISGSNKIRVVVKKGDTLSKILLRETGGYSRASLRRVLRDNPGIEDADRIFIGQVIYISRK